MKQAYSIKDGKYYDMRGKELSKEKVIKIDKSVAVFQCNKPYSSDKLMKAVEIITKT